MLVVLLDLGFVFGDPLVVVDEKTFVNGVGLLGDVNGIKVLLEIVQRVHLREVFTLKEIGFTTNISFEKFGVISYLFIKFTLYQRV